VSHDDALIELMRTIARHDRAAAAGLIEANEALASAQLHAGATREHADEYFVTEIAHHVYRGDTAIHVAAAACEPAIIRELVERGARTDATNRRGAQPLHYAVDGAASDEHADAQRETVAVLIGFGADPNATDNNGTTPLLRAIRNRQAAGVAALLAHGADIRATNKSGSTALQLASWTTGKSGSGSAHAKAQQEEILRLLRAAEQADTTAR
jgi:Ankyrin repeats (many copies)